MNEQHDPARERLLDASLSQLFGRRGGVAPDELAPSPRAPRPNMWLAAALLLLGTFVVVGSWLWSQPADGDKSTAVRPQDPVLPKLWPHDPDGQYADLPLTICERVDQLDRLPADIVNLRVEPESLKDLEELARFTGLRRLHLLGRGPGTFWTMVRATPGALAPLQKLQSLQILKLPPDFALAPAHVRSLRPLRSLQSVSITGSHPLTAEIADELVALPSLRQLEMQLCLVPVSFFESLQRGRLEDLVLQACANIGAPEFAAIGKVRSLRSLAVEMAGMGSCSIDGRRYELLELDDAAFEAFRSLSNLVALDLDESRFDDALMAKLPVNLRYLRLGDHQMTKQTIADLKRLQNLEELRFHHATKFAEVIDLLGALPLQRVWLRGWLNDDVVRALSQHPTLEDVTVRVRQSTDLSPLVRMPKLGSLTVRYDKRFDVRQLPSQEVMKAFALRGVDTALVQF